MCLCSIALTATATPLIHRKRYDIDCNGTPDWCYTDGANARCQLTDGSWTTFPATSSITCPETTTPASSSTYSTGAVSPDTFTATSSTLAAVPTSSQAAATGGALPAPSQFNVDKGLKWKVELQGNLAYTGDLSNHQVVGDKARTGKIGDKVIWNFGDVLCNDHWEVCGFAYGPAWYGTDNVMTVDTSNTSLVQNNDFIQPWVGDEPPQAPHSAWGMDTSNVASINDTHGVAFAWQIWRGAEDGSIVDRGNAVSSITLAPDKPIANRMGPLLTGPDSIQLGLLAILRDGDYIYTYSIGGPSNVIVGRVPADDSVFDAGKYEFLQHESSTSWKPGIPSQTDTSVGATTDNPGGQFGCSVYGSVFFNTYLQKYIMVCNVYLSYVNMYTSDTPYGPWSSEYTIISSGSDGLMEGSYGSHAHPEYGDGKEWYFSIGPNNVFQVFKVTFDY